MTGTEPVVAPLVAPVLTDSLRRADGEPLRMLVISAISRPESSVYVMAEMVAEMCRAEPDVHVDLAHPGEVGVPVNDGTVSPHHPASAAWQRRVAAAHCHLWVSPEYHSGMTGGMKNLFDFLGKETMAGDMVGLVALSGGSGTASHALDNMNLVASALGASVAPEHCSINSNDVKAGLGDTDIARLRRLVASVIGMARRVYP